MPVPQKGTDLSCQCIKLVGKRQLDAAFQQELTFADHVHQKRMAAALSRRAVSRKSTVFSSLSTAR